MPFFNQDIWDLTVSLAPGPDDPQPAFGGMTYNQALQADHDFTVSNVDAAISAQHLDAIIALTDNPAWATDLLYGDHFLFGTSSIAAAGGYPIVQVPAAFPKQCSNQAQPTVCTQFGVPMGLSFFGTAFSEPTLIKLASGFEAVTQVRAHNLPTFAPSAPFTNVQGTTLIAPHRRGVPPASANAKRVPHHL